MAPCASWGAYVHDINVLDTKFRGWLPCSGEEGKYPRCIITAECLVSGPCVSSTAMTNCFPLATDHASAPPASPNTHLASSTPNTQVPIFLSPTPSCPISTPFPSPYLPSLTPIPPGILISNPPPPFSSVVRWARASAPFPSSIPPPATARLASTRTAGQMTPSAQVFHGRYGSSLSPSASRKGLGLSCKR